MRILVQQGSRHTGFGVHDRWLPHAAARPGHDYTSAVYGRLRTVNAARSVSVVGGGERPQQQRQLRPSLRGGDGQEQR